MKADNTSIYRCAVVLTEHKNVFHLPARPQNRYLILCALTRSDLPQSLAAFLSPETMKIAKDTYRASPILSSRTHHICAVVTCAACLLHLWNVSRINKNCAVSSSRSFPNTMGEHARYVKPWQIARHPA